MAALGPANPPHGRPEWRVVLLMMVLASGLGLSIALNVMGLMLATDMSSRHGSSPLVPPPSPPSPTATPGPDNRAMSPYEATTVAQRAEDLAFRRSQVPTPWPTATAAAVPTSTPMVPPCERASPGQTCQWGTPTPRPTWTPTPPPVCGTAVPGMVCVVPTIPAAASSTSPAGLSATTSASSTAPTAGQAVPTPCPTTDPILRVTNCLVARAALTEADRATVRAEAARHPLSPEFAAVPDPRTSMPSPTSGGEG